MAHLEIKHKQEMDIMLRLLKLVGLCGGVLLAGVAQAAMVDLTDDSWSAFESNWVTLSTGDTGRLNFNDAYDGSNPSQCGVLSCTSDGVGIGDDEISHGGERLTASFSSAVTLNSVQFLDLFAAGSGDSLREGARMLVELAGGRWKSLTAFGTALGDAGYLDFAIGLTDVMSISFFTDSKVSENSDFALAGLDLAWGNSDDPMGPDGSDPSSLNDPNQPVSLLQQSPAQSIPAPGPLWLMLLGLVLLWGYRPSQTRRLPMANHRH